jgi:hypothetical protein
MSEPAIPRALESRFMADSNPSLSVRMTNETSSAIFGTEQMPESSAEEFILDLDIVPVSAPVNGYGLRELPYPPVRPICYC